MSGANVLESWEHGSDQKKPELVATFLKEDEHLLWAQRLKSSATSPASYRLGMVHLALAGLLVLIVPWGGSLQDYCGEDPSLRCPAAYYAGWPVLLFVAATSVYQFWSSRNSNKRPWNITYAISSNRAFLIDESQPTKFQYIYLRLHPGKLNSSGAIQFGEDKSMGFIGIDELSAARAVYWATDGRMALAES